MPLIAGAEYTLGFAVSATPGAAVKAVVAARQRPVHHVRGRGRRRRPAPSSGSSRPSPSRTTTPTPSSSSRSAAPPRRSTSAWTTSRCAAARPPEPYVPDTGPRVRVNQVGYLPGGPKNATVVTEATAALPWQLRDAAGAVVASGTTTAARCRRRLRAERADRRLLRLPHRAAPGYTLVADGETSHPFDISGDLYDQLRSDSLQFFYAQRSGIAIDGDLIGDEYARPAGHLGVAPNQGDTDVPCQPGVCDYSLDVRGGWYDAGDHGKYVVNGGIATYQLLNTFERTKTAATADGGAELADSTLRVPERGNARAGHPRRGPLGAGVPAAHAGARRQAARRHGPPQDPRPELDRPAARARRTTRSRASCTRRPPRPPSTWPPPPPSAPGCSPRTTRRSRPAAAPPRQTAYAAAKAHPAVYAEPDRRHRRRRVRRQQRHRRVLLGGGRAVPDHRRADLPGRPDRLAAPHRRRVRRDGGFGWQSVAALGRLDLATVPNGLPAADLARVRASVTAAADTLPRRRCAARRTGCRCPATPAATSGAATATSSTTPWCWPPRST